MNVYSELMMSHKSINFSSQADANPKIQQLMYHHR